MTDYKLINNDTERSKYQKLVHIPQDTEGRKFLEVYKGDMHILFYRISKGVTDHVENQTEIPCKALGWISKAITDGFWRKPTDGGFDLHR